jgi:hypothetical protein
MPTEPKSPAEVILIIRVWKLLYAVTFAFCPGIRCNQSNKTRLMENQIASDNMEVRMLPVRLSMNPQMTKPHIMATFSQTS